MSIPKKKREQIKQYLLEKIGKGDTGIADACAVATGLSVSSVYRYLQQLEEEGAIIRDGHRLYLRAQSHIFTYTHRTLSRSFDTAVYENDIAPLLTGCAGNVLRIWAYAVSEMVNNIIDHSEAETAQAVVLKDAVNTTILLRDDGIGIFRKIQAHFRFPATEDAITALFKGKLTTDAAHHSGEGIFFTSRAMDLFAALSGGKIFTHDDYDELQKKIGDIADLKGWENFPGTVILMRLSNHSSKNLKDVFDAFADEDGAFQKTSIPVSHFFAAPVSRSQARRLAERLELFEVVELDFAGVDWIGQGFAHELFVVWQRTHPGVRLVPLNENEDIRRMIHHVTA